MAVFWGSGVKSKFQDKFYNICDHNKYPSNGKEDEKCTLRKSYFHQIQPRGDPQVSETPPEVIFLMSIGRENSKKQSGAQN